MSPRCSRGALTPRVRSTGSRPACRVPWLTNSVSIDSRTNTRHDPRMLELIVLTDRALALACRGHQELVLGSGPPAAAKGDRTADRASASPEARPGILDRLSNWRTAPAGARRSGRDPRARRRRADADWREVPGRLTRVTSGLITGSHVGRSRGPGVLCGAPERTRPYTRPRLSTRVNPTVPQPRSEGEAPPRLETR